MYSIVIKKFGRMNDVEILSLDNKELKEIVKLSLSKGYELISVNKLNYELASEFLEELKKENKPKDLVFGTNDNYPHVDSY